MPSSTQQSHLWVYPVIIIPVFLYWLGGKIWVLLCMSGRAIRRRLRREVLNLEEIQSYAQDVHAVIRTEPINDDRARLIVWFYPQTRQIRALMKVDQISLIDKMPALRYRHCPIILDGLPMHRGRTKGSPHKGSLDKQARRDNRIALEVMEGECSTEEMRDAILQEYIQDAKGRLRAFRDATKGKPQGKPQRQPVHLRLVQTTPVQGTPVEIDRDIPDMPPLEYYEQASHIDWEDAGKPDAAKAPVKAIAPPIKQEPQMTYAGIVVSYGIEEKPKGERTIKQFCLKIQNAAGVVEPLWGTDLSRVIKEVNVQPGDKVRVYFMGWQKIPPKKPGDEPYTKGIWQIERTG